MNKQLRVRVLPLVLASLLASSPTMAQNTSAAMSGRVTDAAGNAVAGAEVEILHVPSGTTKKVTTDANGRFSAQGLRVGGPFVVDAEKAGLTKAERKDVYLKLAEDTTLDLTMSAEAASLEKIEVTATAASATFQADNKGLSSNVSNAQIQALPSISRSLQDYIRLDPRIVQTDKERGEISAVGQNSRYNNIKIDAVSTNDEFGLEANGLPAQSGTQPISIDTIEELNVSTANFDVSNSRGVGASINAVTKSGTNDFHGSVYYIYRDADMIGDNRAGTKFTSFDQQDNKGFTLGGPIMKDTLFFFVNYEEFKRTKVGPDVGLAGSGATNIAGITQTQLDQLINIAKTKYGFDPGTLNPGADLNDKKYLAKFDWNINDYHRASFRYNRDKSTVPVLERLTGAQVSLSSWWYNKAYDFKNYAFNLYDDWSENFSTETSLSYSKYDNVSPHGPDLPAMAVFVAGLNGAPATTVFFGTERSRQFNELHVKTTNFYSAGNWYKGDHTLKFGVDYKSANNQDPFLQDVFGNYTFASIADFEAGKYSPLGLAANGTTNASGNTLNTQTGYQVNKPTSTLDAVATDWTLGNWGVFLQDTWQATPNLSMQYGIRLDGFTTNEDPGYNPLVLTTFNYDNSASVDGKKVWQPRWSFNYNFDTERSTQLRGGVGLFQGSNPGVWLNNTYANTGLLFTTYTANTGTNFTPDVNNQPNGTAGAQQSVSLLGPNFRPPSVWKASLALDRELPWWGLIGSAEYIYLDVRDGVQFENLNIGTITGHLPDGRNTYWGNIAAGTGPRTGASPKFTNNVVLLKNTHDGKASNLTLSLKKPFSDSWTGQLGYSYGNASESNAGTSSVALSNWNSMSIYNANENVAKTSAAEIQQRFSAALTWRHAFWGDYFTSVSAFTEARSGRPFSYTFSNDANGDGNGGNDLFYVPLNESDVVFKDVVVNGQTVTAATQAANFWNYISNNPYLNSHRGKVVSRNGSHGRWLDQMDLRFSQEIPGIFEGNKGQIWLDVLNFTNLLNKKWGSIEEAPFNANGGQKLSVAQFGGVDPVTGKYIYRYTTGAQGFVTKDNTAESRWSVQVGVKYTF